MNNELPPVMVVALAESMSIRAGHDQVSVWAEYEKAAEVVQRLESALDRLHQFDPGDDVVITDTIRDVQEARDFSTRSTPRPA